MDFPWISVSCLADFMSCHFPFMRHL